MRANNSEQDKDSQMKGSRRLYLTAAGAAAVFLLAALSPIRAVAQSSDVAIVEQSGETLRKLMINPDWTALEQIFADQLSYGHSDGRVQTKAEFVDALVNGKSVFKSISLSAQTVSIAGDVAIIRHRFEADAVSNGTPAQPRIRVLQVWQKQGGLWRLLVRQAH
jgi:ketosteroid isomerase-like protein